TQEAIRTHAGLITMVSPERIQTELTRLLTESSSAGEGFWLLDRTELLPRLLPEISALKGVEQPPEFHPEGDVFTHTMMMLDRMESPSKVLAWAVLLHDIGKPGTYRIGPDKKGGERIRFDGHDEWGATLAETILSRLKFSRKDTEDIVYCVRHHMRFINVPHMRPAKLRRMIGHPCFETLLELHRLDCLASFGGLDTYHLVQKVQAELANQPVLPPRWITGRDLIALGMKPGP
ncbi:MAG: HD domain-containing protein, partial [Kiritimatiellae bacterium]|nr:HD domain-containing protein [Kiritimatiellia bacterium]